ncbi:hypothetical protein PG984_009867 [Apiospora sp. TS-2023a]
MWMDDLETSSGWDAEYGVHGLHLAASFGLTSAVPPLLKSNINVDVADCMDTTPLMHATQAGHADIVHILLHSGADPGRCCRRGKTVLQRACERDAIDIVKHLVESPRDILINEFDQSLCILFQYTALTWAIMKNRPDIVKLLLTRQDINLHLERPEADHQTDLHRAVAWNRIDIVKLILADGRISLESMAPGRKSPLILAAYNGHVGMVTVLLNSGADPNARDDLGGPAILRAVDENTLPCVKVLIGHGADYNFKDCHGRGILHGAAINARSTILRFLLSYADDLNPNIQGDEGETPLHDAVSRNSESTDARNQTPYQRAKRKGFDGIAQYLYDKARNGGGRGLMKHTSSISSSATLIGEAVPDLAESPATNDKDETLPAVQEKAMDQESLQEVPAFKHDEHVSSKVPSGQEWGKDKTEPKRLKGVYLQDKAVKTGREIGSEIATRSIVGHHADMTGREIILAVVVVILSIMLVLR